MGSVFFRAQIGHPKALPQQLFFSSFKKIFSGQLLCPFSDFPKGFILSMKKKKISISFKIFVKIRFFIKAKK